MNISIQHKDSLNATITIQVDKTDYTPLVEKAMKNYQRKAQVPGFRPGKVPMGMIQKMYGTSVLIDEVNRFTSDALNTFIDENKLEVLGQPVLNEETEVTDWNTSQNFTFLFDIGLSPKFDLDITKKDIFTKYIPKIDEELIDKEVERSRDRYANQTTAEVVGDNDIITVIGTELDENGKVLEGGVNKEFTVLTSAIKNEAVKNQFIGQKNGATVVADLFEVFDNNATEISTVLGVSKETVNDLNKQFSFEIKEIKRQEKAELNQELFDKAYGENAVKSIEEYRNKIREELEQFYAAEADHALEHELYDTIKSKHHIELPDAFLKRWLLSRYADKFTPETIDEKYAPEAAYLRSTLFQEAVISANGIQVNEEDLLAASVNYTKRMFFGYNLNIPVSDYLTQYAQEQLKDNNYRSRMLNMAIETKVLAALKDMVTINVEELQVDDFFKKMREHSDKHHHNHEHEHDHDHAHEEAHSH